MQFVLKYFDGRVAMPKDVATTFEPAVGRFTLKFPDGDTHYLSLNNCTIESEAGGVYYTIHSPQYADAYFKLQDPEVIAQYGIYLLKNSNRSFFRRLLDLPSTVIIPIAAAMLGLFLLTYFKVMPFVADRAALALPISYDKQIGDRAFDAIVADLTINDSASAQLNAFVQKLDLGGKQVSKVFVAQSTDINAFAMPNGNIVVYSGLIEKLDSVEQLVALIGHEATHVKKRHSMRLLCRNFTNLIFLSAVIGDINGVASVIVDNADQIVSLSHNRSFETESDKGGLEILVNNKLDPNGMISLLRKLENAEEEELSTNEIPNFMRTHPITQQRIADAKKVIADMPTFGYNKQLQLEFEKIKLLAERPQISISDEEIKEFTEMSDSL